MKTSSLAFLTVAVITGCTAKEAPPADTSVAAADTSAMGSDPDRNVSGGSIPSGYAARTDRSDAPITGASYTGAADGWEVRTGPAHILYAAKDSAKGNYTASATIEQLEAPTHPEAYGLILGGRDLEGPGQTYTYFLVRGTGDLMVRVREGGQTRDVLKWTANPDVPKADASGKATYALSASVAGDAVRFSVNGKQVASVARAGLPTDGIAGLRINHNLHVRATPVSITSP